LKAAAEIKKNYLFLGAEMLCEPDEDMMLEEGHNPCPPFPHFLNFWHQIFNIKIVQFGGWILSAKI